MSVPALLAKSGTMIGGCRTYLFSHHGDQFLGGVDIATASVKEHVEVRAGGTLCKRSTNRHGIVTVDGAAATGHVADGRRLLRSWIALMIACRW